MPQEFPTLLITRPINAARRFADALASETRVNVVISPLIRIENLDVWAEFESVVLTSENGLPQGIVGAGRAAFCVGDRTADIAISAGLEPIIVAKDAATLVPAILADPPKKPLTHLRGEYARGRVAARLTEAGIPCREIITYRQVAQQLSAEGARVCKTDGEIILPLFSLRSARLAMDELARLQSQGELNANIRIVALSDAVADAVTDGFRQNLTVAPHPTGQAMQQIVASLLRN